MNGCFPRNKLNQKQKISLFRQRIKDIVDNFLDDTAEMLATKHLLPSFWDVQGWNFERITATNWILHLTDANFAVWHRLDTGTDEIDTRVYNAGTEHLISIVKKWYQNLQKFVCEGGDLSLIHI